MTGYIYKHTNKATGAVYIGQTTQKVELRWGKDGCNYKGNRRFYREIVKYGWNNFSHEVIEEVKANSSIALKKKLDKIENDYILKYKSMLPKYGYNSAVRTNKLNLKLTQSAKRFISLKMEKGMTLEESYELYKKTRRK